MSDFYMFFTVQFLKIFVTATNNCTKKFLQAHTDLTNSKARYWKTVTFAELTGFVACLIYIHTHIHNQPQHHTDKLCPHIITPGSEHISQKPFQSNNDQ
jgi:hypothetical protein